MKEYNDSRNDKKNTIRCADCGETIKIEGKNCFEFGIYLCSSCYKIRENEVSK